MAAVDPALFGWRLEQLQKQVDVNTEWRETTSAQMAGRNVEFTQLSNEVSALRGDVKGLRQVLLGLACTIACSSVVFGFSILVATGKI